VFVESGISESVRQVIQCNEADSQGIERMSRLDSTRWQS
jgi:hypothetical protein